MIKVIKNTKEQVTFEKFDQKEPWFEHDCSDVNLLKHCNRRNDIIKNIKFDDGKYIGSLLHVYFKKIEVIENNL
jgi:hypothetical protein